MVTAKTPFPPTACETVSIWEITMSTSMYLRSQEYYRMDNHKLIIAGYVRNSDPSKKDTEILNAQKEALRAYALKEYGVDIPDVLMYEDAISSLKYAYWERPGLMQAWDEGENKRFDVILCTEFFRIARKSAEQAAVMEYFKRYGIEVVSITEKFEDTAEGRLLHAVQGFLGEIEAEKTRIRTSRGKRHRQTLVLTGQGKRTYGLVYVDNDDYTNAYYVPNTQVVATIDGKEWTEIDVLAYERECVLKGISTNQIAISLTRMGIPTQTGNHVWNRTTILQHLTNGNYRGYPYAVNNRWIKEGHKSSVRRANHDEMIQLPEGIYPRLVDPEEFDRVQEQLKRNKEMAARNNKHPNDTVLRSLIYCGICGNKMHVAHHTKPQGAHVEIQRSEYCCKKNQGVDEIERHHCVSISVDILDDAAWKFALPYIHDPKWIRAYIAEMRGQSGEGKHVASLEAQIDDITARIVNLLTVAESARDDITRHLYRERLAGLERERRDTEALLSRFTNTIEREERLNCALTRFENWALDQCECLDDPDYVVSKEDKIAAMLVLGVTATVWPVSCPKRVEFKLRPAEVNRHCDIEIVKAIQYAAGKMQAAEQVPVSAGERGE
jgi:DNA invertase Pin-like site-specific DNA recombinase